MNGYKILPVLLIIALPALLLVGCYSRENPAFQSAGLVPTLPGSSVAPHASRVAGLSRDDETRIEMQVFRTLLAKDPWNGNGLTALFLQADDAEVSQLRTEFPGIIPPIKLSNRVDLSNKNEPLDRDTGKPALILSVEISRLNQDGSVPATGKWFGAGANTGLITYVLKKNGDNWEIESRE